MYYSNYDSMMEAESSATFSKLMRSVFTWMALALVVTGMTAVWTSNYIMMHTDFLVAHPYLPIVLMVAEVGAVIWLSAGINRMSFMTAGLLFAAYSVLNGLTLSVLLLAYTASSVSSAFFATAGMFGAMALVGYTTKKDLSKMGSILSMAIIGLIIATVVNIFWANSTLYWIVTYLGVIIFTGLTAWDVQSIKRMLAQYGYDVNEQTQKAALMGSMKLYLDFVNLFIYMVRIMGDRR